MCGLDCNLHRCARRYTYISHINIGIACMTVLVVMSVDEKSTNGLQYAENHINFQAKKLEKKISQILY